MKHLRAIGFLTSVFLVVSMVGISYADDVTNNIDDSLNASAEQISLLPGGATRNVTYSVIPRNGDGTGNTANGCNFTAGTGGGTLSVSVGSSNPAAVTVSPTTLTFNACDDPGTPNYEGGRTITVTSHAAGRARIELTQTSNTTVGSFFLKTADFEVTSNTPPQIAVTGVTHGATYTGSAPAAGCTVTDPDQPGATATPTLSNTLVGGLGTQTATCSFTDNLGATTSAAATYTIVAAPPPPSGDTTPPEVTYSLSGTVGNNGWYTSDVVVTWTATDGESTATQCLPETLTASGTALCSSTSTGGTTDAETDQVNIDKTPPTLTWGTPTGTAGDNGWWKSDVSNTWTCSDGGSGTTTTGGSDTTSGEGATRTISGSCTNNAGLTTNGSQTYKVDKTAPTLTWGTPTGTAGDNDWYTSDVSISWTCSDGTGGSGATTTGGDGSTTGEGNDQQVNGSCSDDAGWTTSDSKSYKVDMTAPEIDVTSPTGSYTLASVQNAAYSCTDATSGLATNPDDTDWCNGTVANGDPIDTATVGGKDFAVEAKDQAGNVATWPAVSGTGLSLLSTTTFEYNVVYAPAGTCLAGPGRQILQPINRDGTSVFKLGSTVPVKFRVCDANGNAIGDPGVVTSFTLVKKMAGLVELTPNEPIISTTPDTAFRWSADGQQWIFNLNSKNLAGGTTYTYRIGLNDGSNLDFTFGLKK